MNFLALLWVALRALSRHRMRALLTALGIIIGVGAFITMVAIGRGATKKVNAQIASMGSNMLVVFGGSSQSAGVRGGSGSSGNLTDGDVEAIRKHCDAVRAAAPVVSSNAQVMWSGANWSTSITGTTPDYLTIRDWKVERGSSFGARDVDTANKVCVIGQTVVEQLFGAEEPLGQTLRVRSITCEVIGVLAKKGQNQMGQDQDDTILMPINTVRRKLFNAGPSGASRLANTQTTVITTGTTAAAAPTAAGSSGLDRVQRIMLSAQSAADTKRAAQQTQELLRQRKNTSEGDPADPTVRDLTEFAEAAQEATRTMTLLLAGIAAVSLIVGGIGIMNIMLVSVTERTREIGIRMAIGAKGHHILLQFLFEAMLLTIAGGFIGMAIGTMAAQAFAKQMDWPVELGAASYTIGFSFSTVVGLLFGFYPAWRASRLDPIDALRYE
ncbi:MAG: ABC transporter permease [Deltaproteobacteria bacterium]|nr:ABC transporter permease [Deltaproteobacteria bacterium]